MEKTSGIFAVYKPKGPTSYDILREIKKTIGDKKIGHAGTLDPLASGVLVIGIGREATKRLGGEVKKEKEYLAEIKLGVISSTDDEEGDKTEKKIIRQPSKEEVGEVLKKFEGKIMQVPPIFSAIKISGKSAYKLARQGKAPELKAREVEIKKINLIKYQWPFLELSAVTGPGVYIRSLARDIGKELGCGGYLADLERIRVGQFTKENSVRISDLSVVK
ncbi:MAG: tRNA pseudouridine(55) synthase TruB [Candidatus Harrisonbacteria bacterium]|nr:tRNA pseudouridine(55) synthase TruB [Candidatus Harrisonbacteria bacterium]